MGVMGKQERPANSTKPPNHRFLSNVPPDTLPLTIDAEELCCLFTCAKSPRPTVVHLLVDAASSIEKFQGLAAGSRPFASHAVSLSSLSLRVRVAYNSLF